VSKLLVRLQLAGGRAPAPGSVLERQGEAIGTLTSAAEVPGEDRVVALGYLRDDDAQAGREIEVPSGPGPRRATSAGPARRAGPEAPPGAGVRGGAASRVRCAAGGRRGRPPAPGEVAGGVGLRGVCYHRAPRAPRGHGGEPRRAGASEEVVTA